MFPFDPNLSRRVRCPLATHDLRRVACSSVGEARPGTVLSAEVEQQRPLPKIAPHHDQGLKIRNRIDTFDNHDTAETVGKINRRLAYRGIGDVFLTNKACSLSSVNGRSRRLENDE